MDTQTPSLIYTDSRHHQLAESVIGKHVEGVTNIQMDRQTPSFIFTDSRPSPAG